MSKLLNLSSNPHIRDNVTTAEIMRDVFIALIPTTLYGIIQWGFNAALVCILTVAAAVISELVYEKCMKLPITIKDWSAAVTGLILALNCPPNIPAWIPCLGAVFAIIIVKQLYGGLGKNFMNPALAARCFLLISFAGKMTSFTGVGADALSGATPLAFMKTNPDAIAKIDLGAAFLGRIPGTIGEVSKLCVLIGAAYLIIRKVISPKIPLIYIGTVAVFTLLFGGHGFDLYYLACELCAGGLIFGAFFMATDYVTSPITPLGQIIFAIMLGILTGLFRLFGGSAEGVSYAIIICNILVPMINVHTVPKAFGKEGAKK
ncbi:RnfABCDGE type electron transport complex subunit D [Oribacterium sp. P9]|uniref:RnfABCDGE type electron transport complex subunit D n=1 Tax=unclassified Oribacterium TaxID=2629782 RepID=UPI002A7D1E6C|nr:RnfABCDGE type electron transport complex subunit D [Oribacterium sp.]MDD6519032.1 RnfABCDGE type electron transport complex subunit D [Oribacterium sp.]MDY2854595.1 RnfABCDGE type electron transport complex subunit D [Oliverpabstia sp.]MEE1378490.1 RnfABCDGE type electron transport complex subunit D [Oribacterium sp.]